MNKLLKVVAILLVLSSSAFAQERTWITFSPDNGTWSILAPGTMKPDAEALESPSTKGSYSYNDSTGFFAVVYRDNPKWLHTIWKPFINSHYNKMRNEFVKSVNGQVLKDEKFSNGNINGREVFIKMPDGRVLDREGQVKTRHRMQRLRMFFHGSRFYVLLAVLPENLIEAPAINNYFNSFVTNTAPSANPDNFATNEDSPLSVNVLMNDTDKENETLTAILVSPPAHGSLKLNQNGSFTYTPNSNYAGSDTFSYKAYDGKTHSQEAAVNIMVNAVNDAPSFTKGADQTVEEDAGAQSISGWAKSISPGTADESTQSVNFIVSNDSNKLFTVQPGISPDGNLTFIPALNANGKATVSVRLQDNGGTANGGLNSSEAQTFIINVTPVNDAPVLLPVGNQTVDEQTLLNLLVRANDVDASDTLTYSLVSAPDGATIDRTTGTFSWTPAEAQDGTYTFRLRVTDSGAPSLYNEEQIIITVNEVNQAPVLAHINGKTINEETQLTFDLTAKDADLPANTLFYSLSEAPAGATIDSATGVFRWTPTEEQNGSYNFKVKVSDNAASRLSDEKQFTVTVNEVNRAPKIASIGNKTVDKLTALSFTVIAADADSPANTLSFSLVGDVPAGAVINPTTGVFTWKPNESQAPGNYSITFRVTDNGTPVLFDEKTITVTVKELNSAPVPLVQL